MKSFEKQLADKERRKELKWAEEKFLLEMERFIHDRLEENYEQLRLEGGQALTPSVKNQALNQVRMYFRKLRKVAETVTDTEVKLTLPQQTSPKGHKFTVEGVVDIIRDEERQETIMYDIKTHRPSVRGTKTRSSTKSSCGSTPISTKSFKRKNLTVRPLWPLVFQPT